MPSFNPVVPPTHNNAPFTSLITRQKGPKYQMAGVGVQQPTYSPRDMFPSFIPIQPQNIQVLPITPANDVQLEHHLHIDTPQLVGGVVARGRLHDPHHIDVAYRGMVGYQPLPLHDPTAQYMFPDIGHDQGINPQAQPNPPDYHGRGPFGYGQAPQHVARGPDPVAFHDRFVHQMPAPDQPRAAAENLRQLASRYLNHPDSRVDLFYMEPGAGADCDVVIILKMPNVLAVTTPENRF